MNQSQDITEAITSFRPSPTPQNLNKRTVRTVTFPPSRVRTDKDFNKGEGKNVQGLTSEASEPSEIHPPLPPDQAAWLPVARQVLAGEFDGCDPSMKESLSIGLRSIPHPLCHNAIRKLWPDGLPRYLN